MTFRFTNPFTIVSKLKERIADLEISAERDFASLRFLAKDRNAYRDYGNNLERALHKTSGRLAGHRQAVEAFMVERETFKDRIALAELVMESGDAYIESLEDGLLAAGAAVAEHDEAIEAGTDVLRLALDAVQQVVAERDLAILEANKMFAETQEQAQEIVEIVSWVKAAEAVLLAAGIAVGDGDNGPYVYAVEPARADQMTELA